jgi:hypothetical protein
MPPSDAKPETAKTGTTIPSLRCYRCGASLAALSLPLSRLDMCPACSVELHVCRMCLHFAPNKPDACDEEDAIEVKNKTVANFCDYFAPNAHAYDGLEQAADARARAALDALFGASSSALDPGDDSEAARALRQAEDLFRK